MRDTISSAWELSFGHLLALRKRIYLLAGLKVSRTLPIVRVLVRDSSLHPIVAERRRNI